MNSQEGVVKFNLTYTPGPAPEAALLREINAWRTILMVNGLIGQNPARYGGFGFGNLSLRLPPWDAPPHARPFIISGTQTGHLAELGPEQYAIVLACDPAANHVIAGGPARPSSESLTHAAVYTQDSAVRVVMHVHSPEMWHCAALLGLPTTAVDVPYGSPEMAAEVARLFQVTDVAARRIFAMGGHEDGIVAFAADATTAGRILLDTLAAAQRLTG